MRLLNPPIQRTDAREIVNFACGGERNLLGVVPLGGGQINSTGMLILDDGQRLVLRIAPDPGLLEDGPGWLSPFGLRREAAVVQAAPHLAPMMPVTVMHGFGGTVIERDWVLQEVMPGVPLDTLLASLDDESAATIWTEVGGFMRSLHDARQGPFGPLVWGPRFETWLDLLRNDLESLQGDAERLGLPAEPFRRLAESIERGAGVLAAVAPALIHSDLNPAHIFVTDNDEDGSLHVGGVIDLEYGRVADPLSEHLLAFALTEPSSSPTATGILAGYGTPGPFDSQARRIGIASALGAGWDATLLQFQQRDPGPALNRLDRVLAKLEEE